MNHSIVGQVPFGLVGEFLGFINTKNHQPRAVKLRWLNQEIVIKLAKYLRDDQSVTTLIPGTHVQVWGIQKPSRERSHLKLKVHRISKSQPHFLQDHSPILKVVNPQIDPKIKSSTSKIQISIVTIDDKTHLENVINLIQIGL